MYICRISVLGFGWLFSRHLHLLKFRSLVSIWIMLLNWGLEVRNHFDFEMLVFESFIFLMLMYWWISDIFTWLWQCDSHGSCADPWKKKRGSLWLVKIVKEHGNIFIQKCRFTMKQKEEKIRVCVWIGYGRRSTLTLSLGCLFCWNLGNPLQILVDYTVKSNGLYGFD